MNGLTDSGEAGHRFIQPEPARSLAKKSDANSTIYDTAHKLYLEYLMQIPIIQPIESYGIQRYVDWKPRGNQLFYIEDVKLKR